MKKDARLEKQLANKFLHHEGKRNEKAVAEIKALSALMEESPEVRGFLGGPQFSPGEKKKFLAGFSKSGLFPLSDGTREFLEYLTDRDAAALIPGIARNAEALYMEHARRAKAVVISAGRLDEAAGQRLKEALGKLTGREVEMEYVQDPSILGGVLVKIGSTMFDSSLRGQLRILKEELIKG